MQVDIWNQDGRDYFLLTMVVPPLEEIIRSILADLQDIEKLCPELQSSDFKIFDVNTEPYWEDAAKISIIVPLTFDYIAPLVKTLIAIEEKQRNPKR